MFLAIVIVVYVLSCVGAILYTRKDNADYVYSKSDDQCLGSPGLVLFSVFLCFIPFANTVGACMYLCHLMWKGASLAIPFRKLLAPFATLLGYKVIE
jgi:Mn2+/Fe2+ NRAMP family transporter